MTSQAQVRRLLSLVPYLREHDGIAMTDVAAAFGITLKTLREDLSVLWMCGMPGLTPGDLIDIDMDAVDGEGVIHLSNADYLTRPLRLSADEALALVLALRTLREIADPGQREAVDRALKKLGAAAGDRAHPDQATVAVTAARDDIQARVNDGLQRRKRLDLTYDVATRAETTRRLVDPLRVFVLEGYGYLEAWCYSAKALRTFRLDRIVAVEVTDVDVDVHDVQLKDLSTGWFEALKDAPLVSLELQPWAAWVAEYYPTESVQRFDDGRLAVSVRVTDPAWLRNLLLRLRGSAKVLAPAGAGDSAAEAAREALEQYEAAFHGPGTRPRQSLGLRTVEDRVTAPQRSRLWLIIVGVVVAVALAARLVPMLRGGGLFGLGNSDDGVYYAAAVALVHGHLPYRDFLLLHPPGIVVALAPFAALGRLIGEHEGFALARLAWVLLGAVNAVLVSRILRPIGLVGAALGGLCYAVLYPAVYVEWTTQLQGLGNTLLLVSLLLLSKGRTARLGVTPTLILAGAPSRRIGHRQDLGSGSGPAGGGLAVLRPRRPPGSARSRWCGPRSHCRLPALLSGCTRSHVEVRRHRSARPSSEFFPAD